MPSYTRPAPQLRFNMEGKVFTCFNSPLHPSMLPPSALPMVPKELPLVDDYSPRYLRRINMQHEKYPYLAFIPTFPSASGPILGRFSSLEVVEVGDGWKLRTDIEKSWIRLGDAVRELAHHLFKKLPTCPIKLEDYTRPERYGYLFSYRSKESAWERIKESREAFSPLLAMLTFVIAIYEFGPDSGDSEFSSSAWVEHLLDININSTWLDDLRNCQIADFSTQRVGVILDFSVASNYLWWNRYIDVYIRAGIPIYINWGLDPKYVRTSTIYEAFRPSVAAFLETLEKYEIWLNSAMDVEKRKTLRGERVFAKYWQHPPFDISTFKNPLAKDPVFMTTTPSTSGVASLNSGSNPNRARFVGRIGGGSSSI